MNTQYKYWETAYPDKKTLRIKGEINALEVETRGNDGLTMIYLGEKNKMDENFYCLPLYPQDIIVLINHLTDQLKKL